jgi:hypothetical protein
MHSVHYIHHVEFAAYRGHECRIQSDVFVEVADNTNRPTVRLVNSKLVRKVVNCLESRVWSAITTVPTYVPLLGKDSVNTGLFNSCFAAVVKAIKKRLAVGLSRGE